MTKFKKISDNKVIFKIGPRFFAVFALEDVTKTFVEFGYEEEEIDLNEFDYGMAGQCFSDFGGKQIIIPESEGVDSTIEDAIKLM